MSDLVVKNKVAQYLLINQEIKDLKAQQERLKQELEPDLQSAETNARGSRVLVFSDALEVAGTRYSGLQKVRKESRVLNEERVMRFLMSRADSEDELWAGWDDLVSSSGVIVTVQHIDQDVLWDLYVQDMISQEELDSFFDVTESYAFMPTKE
jgi:hypothetical protein